MSRKRATIGDEDDVKASYRWEQGAGQQWEQVREDESGNIVVASFDRERSKRAKQQRVTQSIRRGLIRYLIVAIDCSTAAGDKDMRPSRLENIKNCLKRFTKDFFDQNPISQLGLCITRNSIAEKLTDLSGNPKNHEHSLSKLLSMDGLASLQNTLILANGLLRTIPDYGHRELLIVYSSVKSTDPGDIFATIEEAVKLKIRINVICIAAELFIARHMAERTGGSFAVALDVTHLQELLVELTIPPPELQQRGALTTEFIYMGFPKRTFDAHPSFGFDGMQMVPFSTAYICPRCHTRSSEIPRDCAVCKLQLSSSSHIARSHHHLFPVPNFVELSVIVSDTGELVAHNVDDTSAADDGADAGTSMDPAADVSESDSALGGSPRNSVVGLVGSCTGCLGAFTSTSLVMMCPSCESMFCVECDLFVHNSLHNCPGCL